MKILCIGNSTYDITFPVSDFVKENTKNRLKECVKCGGGPASNAAYLLGKWGTDVYFAGVVGMDYYGNKIKQELESVKVNTAYLELSDKYSTPISTIIANKNNGSRTILSYREDKMKMNDIDIAITPDIILMDGREFDMSEKLLEKYPDAISIIDAGSASKEVVQLCKKVDYVVCSKDFAENVSKVSLDLTNVKTIKEMFLNLKKLFSGKIVVTLENMGAIYEEDNKINIMKSLTVESVDTTGAGDIFHGAFTYGISRKFSLSESIKIANIAGALSTTVLGGRLSTPSKEKVKNILNEYR